MQKKKTKDKKIHHKLTFWLSILFLGMLVGVSIQFTRAWVEPSESVPAPDGNIAAPINTGASKQVKKGTASNPADICVDKTGDGDEKCLGDLVTFPNCTLSGGVPVSVGALTICRFAGASCPENVEINPTTTINWTQYLKYSETIAQSCSGGVTSGSHLFADIDPVTEAKPWSTRSWDSCCYTTGDCPPGTYHGCARDGDWCPGAWCDYSVCHGCWSGGDSGTCSSIVTSVGCIQS